MVRAEWFSYRFLRKEIHDNIGSPECYRMVVGIAYNQLVREAGLKIVFEVAARISIIAFKSPVS
jgi:hypothetical protein